MDFVLVACQSNDFLPTGELIDSVVDRGTEIYHPR